MNVKILDPLNKYYCCNKCGGIYRLDKKDYIKDLQCLCGGEKFKRVVPCVDCGATGRINNQVCDNCNGLKFVDMI
jgi:hypothetical protein